MRASILLAFVLAVFPAAASADCVMRSGCICSSQVATAVAVGPLVSVNGGSATMRVEALTGTPAGVSVGDTLTIDLVPSDRHAGDKALAAQFTDHWSFDVAVGQGDSVSCVWVPEAHLTVSQVTQLVMRSSCNADFETILSQQGIGPQKCNDVIYGCQQVGPSALGLVAAALLRLRRRRSR